MSLLAVLTWAIGVWTSYGDSSQHFLWWQIEPRESVTAPFEPLAEFAVGAAEVDYLMNSTPG
ncbi:MAG: hypothetical protein GY953_08315, partial [bacterium]|nr:hypothetical protein [bacterium]